MLKGSFVFFISLWAYIILAEATECVAQTTVNEKEETTVQRAYFLSVGSSVFSNDNKRFQLSANGFYQHNNHLFSARASVHATTYTAAFDLSLMYGSAIRVKWFKFYAAAGPAVYILNETRPGSEIDDFQMKYYGGISASGEMGVVIVPLKYCGIGVKYCGTLRKKNSALLPLLTLEFGKIRP